MSDWAVAAPPFSPAPEVVRRRRLTLAAMCIAQGMTLLDVTIVNTALPSIQRDLHMTPGQLEWVISAYALSLAAFIPLGGALGDRFGRKRLFLSGMVVFTVGSIACALSSTDLELIGARAFQGVGGAVMSALTLSILTETYPPARRAGAFGIWAAIAGLGFGLGPVVGGLLLSVFDWSSIFWVNVPIAIAGFVVAALAVAESRGLERPSPRRGRGGRPRPRPARHHLRPHRVVHPSLGKPIGGRPARGRRGLRHRVRAVGAPDVGPHAPAAAASGSQLRDRLRRLSARLPGPHRRDVLRHPAVPEHRRVVPAPHRALVVVHEHPVPRHRPVRRSTEPTSSSVPPSWPAVAWSAPVAWRRSAHLAASTPFAVAFVGYVLLGSGWGALVPSTINVAMRDVPLGTSGGGSAIVNAARQVGTSVGLAVLGAIGVNAATSAWAAAPRRWPGPLEHAQAVAGAQIALVTKSLGPAVRSRCGRCLPDRLPLWRS